MSRCRACDVELSEFDLRRTNKNGDPEEYCVTCRVASDYPDNLDWRWCQFEDLCSDSVIDDISKKLE